MEVINVFIFYSVYNVHVCNSIYLIKRTKGKRTLYYIYFYSFNIN